MKGSPLVSPPLLNNGRGSEHVDHVVGEGHPFCSAITGDRRSLKCRYLVLTPLMPGHTSMLFGGQYYH